MDSRYDKFKSGLGSENKPVPPEFEWENMQEGIYEKMEQLQKPAHQKRKWIITVTIGILILMLIQFICTPFAKDQIVELNDDQVQVNGTSGTNLNQVEEYSKSSSNLSEVDKQVITKDDENSVVNSGVNQTSSSELIVDPKEEQNLSSKRNFITENEMNKSGSSDEGISENMLTTNDYANSTAPNDPVINKQAIDETIDNAIVDQESQAFTASASKSPLPLISLLQLLSPQLKYNRSIDDRPEFHVMPLDNENESKSTKYNRKSMSLIGGITHWSEGFGKILPERHPFEKTIASFYASFNYQHRLSYKYALLVGLQYTQLDSRFDYETTIENYTTVMVDTIIGVVNNLISGKQTFERGEIELPVDAQRTIRHYNSIRLIQLPVALGRIWEKDKWQLGLYAGGTLNISSSVSGRTLYNSDIADYSNLQTEVMSPSLKLNGLLAGQISYALSDRMGISTQIQLQRSLMNWSNEEGIQMNPMILNWGIGLNYIITP